MGGNEKAQRYDNEVQQDEEEEQWKGNALPVESKCHRQHETEKRKDNPEEQGKPLEEDQAQMNRTGVVSLQCAQGAIVSVQLGSLPAVPGSSSRAVWYQQGRKPYT